MKGSVSIKKKFGGIVIPENIVGLLPSINLNQLKTFIYLCSCNSLIPDEAAQSLGISRDEFDEALAYCRGTGLFATEDSNEPQSASRRHSLQSYDSETLAMAVKEESEFALLTKEIGSIIGKVINKNDINMLFNLYDYEGISPEYICAVANYAVRRSKGSMAYIVRTTLSIRDEGIDSYDKLEEYISKRESSDIGKAKLWKKMGFGNRAPSAKEKAYLTKWFDEYAMSDEIINAAYEITVDAIGTARPSYMAKILDDWFEKGYTTVEQIEASKGIKKNQSSSANSSFDIDELYNTAVRKGMDENQ